MAGGRNAPARRQERRGWPLEGRFTPTGKAGGYSQKAASDATRRSSLSPFYGARVARTGRSEPGEGQCTAPHPTFSLRSKVDLSPHRGEREEARVRNRPYSLAGAGYAVVPAPHCEAFFTPPTKYRGDGAPSGAAISLCARTVSSARRLSARHRRRFLSPGPRFLVSVPFSSQALAPVRLIGLSRPRPVRKLWSGPSPAGSLRSGRSTARSGPGASRVRGCEPRPRAPHPIPLS